MAYLTRRQTILAKVEVTYGVDPSPDPAANAILCGQPRVTFTGETLERDNIKADLSPMQHLIGLRYVEIEIPFEFKPSGTLGTAPEMSPLLQAAGLYEVINPGVDVTYTPLSDSIPSIAIWYCFGGNPDGAYSRLLGVRGDISVSWSAGRWGAATFRGRGLYKGPEDFPNPTGTYNPILPPQFLEVGFTLGLASPAISKLDFNLENTLTNKIDITQTHGIGEIWVTGRRPNGVIDPETVAPLTKDYWAEWLACTEQQLQVVYGTVGGSRSTLTVPKAQYLAAPSPVDSDGLLRGELPFKCNRNAGDDEFSIVFD